MFKSVRAFVKKTLIIIMNRVT